MPMTCLYLPANLHLGQPKFLTASLRTSCPILPARKVTYISLKHGAPYDAKNRAVKALAALNRIDQHLQVRLEFMATWLLSNQLPGSKEYEVAIVAKQQSRNIHISKRINIFTIAYAIAINRAILIELWLISQLTQATTTIYNQHHLVPLVCSKYPSLRGQP